MATCPRTPFTRLVQTGPAGDLRIPPFRRRIFSSKRFGRNLFPYRNSSRVPLLFSCAIPDFPACVKSKYHQINLFNYCDHWKMCSSETPVYNFGCFWPEVFSTSDTTMGKAKRSSDSQNPSFLLKLIPEFF